MADTKSMVDEILKRVLMRIDSANLGNTTVGATSKVSSTSSSSAVSTSSVGQLQTSMITEHVGSTTTGDTVGLVIANVDSQVLEAMKLTKSYRILGTSELNFCVRNGNRWNLTVIVTDQYD